MLNLFDKTLIFTVEHKEALIAFLVPFLTSLTFGLADIRLNPQVESLCALVLAVSTGYLVHLVHHG